MAARTIGRRYTNDRPVTLVYNSAAEPRVLARLDQRNHPRLKVVWADGKCHNHALNAWKKQKRLPWRLEIVNRPKDANGFVPLPKRWVVERTFAWLARSRRNPKDHERLTASSESMIPLSTIHTLLKRLEPNKRQPPFTYRLTG